MRLTFQRILLASLLSGLATLLYLTQPRYIVARVPHISPKLFGSSEVASQNPALYRHSTADPAILGFWKHWAEHILAAKPQTQPVRISWPATNHPAPENESHAHRKRPVSHTQLDVNFVASLKASHAQFRQALDDLEAADAALTLYDGTGVVTVAGGEYFGPSIVGIKMLRQTGSTLPVEVFLADWKEYEADICETVLPEINAKCIVLEDFVAREELQEPSDGRPQFKVSHYQLKSLALLFSSFRNILYLDSDSMPLVEPQSELFDKDPYVLKGYVGWPDFWLGTEEFKFYEIAGLDGFPNNLPAPSSESGQILVDKERHLKTLLLAAYYNIWGPDWFYPLLSQGALGEGDKNTFETAAIVLGLPYYRVKTPVTSLGRRNKGEYRGSAMVQYHPGDDFLKFEEKSENNGNGSYRRQVDAPLGSIQKDVRPAFIHSNTPKMNSGHLVDEGDLQDEWTGKSLRLWGLLSEQQALFGKDLERETWEIVVDVGCRLAPILREWKDRKNMCKRLKKHWHEVFEKDS